MGDLRPIIKWGGQPPLGRRRGWFVQGLRFSLDLGCSKCVPIRFPIMFLLCSQVPTCSPRCPNSTTKILKLEWILSFKKSQNQISIEIGISSSLGYFNSPEEFIIYWNGCEPGAIIYMNQVHTTRQINTRTT